MMTVVLIAALAASAAAVQDVPRTTPTEQHEWLGQLVGEWTVRAEATMAPDAEPMEFRSTERVRAIGGLWIVAEGSASFDGTPFTSVMTLGYDTRRKAFVGTWIDTIQTHMWSYRGTLDEAGKVLTLEAEGPSFDDPERDARYRDVIEIKSRDHRLLRSSVQGEDGAWTTFMQAEYRRQKPAATVPDDPDRP